MKASSRYTNRFKQRKTKRPWTGTRPRDGHAQEATPTPCFQDHQFTPFQTSRHHCSRHHLRSVSSQISEILGDSLKQVAVGYPYSIRLLDTGTLTMESNTLMAPLWSILQTYCLPASSLTPKIGVSPPASPGRRTRRTSLRQGPWARELWASWGENHVLPTASFELYRTEVGLGVFRFADDARAPRRTAQKRSRWRLGLA